MSQELKIHRCCFAGHRPEKLTADSATIKEALATEVDRPLPMASQDLLQGWRLALIYGQPS